MLAVLGDTALIAWSLPPFAVVLLFGVYFLIKADTPDSLFDR